jgi:hypothetical protein
MGLDASRVDVLFAGLAQAKRAAYDPSEGILKCGHRQQVTVIDFESCTEISRHLGVVDLVPESCGLVLGDLKKVVSHRRRPALHFQQRGTDALAELGQFFGGHLFFLLFSESRFASWPPQVIKVQESEANVPSAKKSRIYLGKVCVFECGGDCGRSGF